MKDQVITLGFESLQSDLCIFVVNKATGYMKLCYMDDYICVDVDVAGLWNCEDKEEDPICVRTSRTGQL